MYPWTYPQSLNVFAYKKGFNSKSDVLLQQNKKLTPISFSNVRTVKICLCGSQYYFCLTLVEPAGKFSMLHPCMHSNFLINIENTESTHGEIL